MLTFKINNNHRLVQIITTFSLYLTSKKLNGLFDGLVVGITAGI